MEAPIFIGSIELTEPVGGLELPARPDGATWTQVRMLVRMQGHPVGYALLRGQSADAACVASQIWAQVGDAVNARRAARGLAALAGLPAEGIGPGPRLVPDLTEFPLVSVVLCTRDRPAGAMVTLRGLTALRYDPFEIVVVDNAPSSDATEAAVRAEFGADPRVRYIREPRLVSGVLRIFAIRDRVHGNASLPAGLTRQEFRGMLLGPWLYYRGRRGLPRYGAGGGRRPAGSRAMRRASTPRADR